MLRSFLRALTTGPYTDTTPEADADAVARLAGRVDSVARARFGRSLCIREVDAGSCNGCELEIHAINGPHYDVERFGLRFVASPRHADVLLVTGPVTTNMAEALRRTYEATPEPKWVVAAGQCAIDGHCFAGSHAVLGGVRRIIPVDVTIQGCPPTPAALLEGLLALLEHRPAEHASRQVEEAF